jgi:HD-like signal output (HDOD) protein
MAGINKSDDLGVFIICDSNAPLESRIRDGLEGHGVIILEKEHLDAEALEGLFFEYVVAKTGEGPPAELPSPEEIRKRLEHDIKSMVDLPVLPQVYQQIVALDRDPESELEAWISAIEADPLSRAQVIRRARSPLYGFQGEITDARRAVILLGKNAVKEIIVTGAVKKSLEGVSEEGFDVEDYWIHSVAVAITAKILRFPQEPKEWTPDNKREFEEYAFDDEVVQALKKAGLYKRIKVGPHADPFVGGILAQSWQLGDEVHQVAETHHDEKPKNTLAELIALADFLAGGLYPFPKQAEFPTVGAFEEGAAYGGDESLSPFLSESVLSNSGLGLEGLIGLGKAIAPTIRRLTESMRESV